MLREIKYTELRCFLSFRRHNGMVRQDNTERERYGKMKLCSEGELYRKMKYLKQCIICIYTLLKYSLVTKSDK